ncbi:hypothetical protein MALGJ_35850 [Mycolicibacter algericus]|uniref:Uncharacterized protein n=1 Tax=Mycolicibacter algericus TaxID=1288388 RepID=A0A7I9YDY2_MYCAL|nr:hypothetical protein MALGJ_35850 [Mycolicibacter algericus]
MALESPRREVRGAEIAQPTVGNHKLGVEHRWPRTAEPAQNNPASANKSIEAFLKGSAKALLRRAVRIDHCGYGTNCERWEQEFLKEFEPLVVPESPSNMERVSGSANNVENKAIETFHVRDWCGTGRGGEHQSRLRGRRAARQRTGSQHLANDH